METLTVLPSRNRKGRSYAQLEVASPLRVGYHFILSATNTIARVQFHNTIPLDETVVSSTAASIITTLGAQK